MSELVTVLIAHYRCEAWVAQAAASVLHQHGGSPNVWVVDDDSADFARLLAVLAPLRHRLRLWRSSRNVGQFRLYNRLLPLVETPYVALQDADDWSAPDRIRKLLAFATTNRLDLAGSYANVVDKDSNRGEIARPPRDVNQALRWRCRGRVALGASLLCRTDFLRQLGGYDGGTHIGADSDLIYRAVFAGRVGNLAEPLYCVRQRDDSLTQASETGHGSRLRKAYRRAIRARFYRNRLRALLHYLRPEDLLARPNDIEFTLEEVW